MINNLFNLIIVNYQLLTVHWIKGAYKMIVVLKQKAKKEQIERLTKQIEAKGLKKKVY